MTNRNPYENGVDIPDFVEKNDESIDMSVFRMDTEESPKSQYDFDDEDDEYENEPNRNPKAPVLVIAILAVVFLIAAIAGWIFGISKNNAYKKIEADYQTLSSQLTEEKNKASNLEAQISQLNTQIEALTKSNESSSSDESGDYAKYEMLVGVKVRTGAGTKYQCVSEKKVSDEVAEMCDFNEDITTIREGSVVKVYETKVEANATWGRIDTEAWVCLKAEDGEAYASKK